MTLQPLTIRDIRLGVIRLSSVNDFLAPQNSVSHSININYDTIIGSGVVRPGTAVFSSSAQLNRQPLGLNTFTTVTTNIIVGAFKGASNGSLYWWDSTQRTTTNKTALSNTAKVRFAQLGKRIYMANGSDAMSGADGGTTWTSTSCLSVRVPSLLISARARMLAAGDSQFPSRVWFSSIVSSTAAGVGVLTWNENTSTGDYIDINPDDGGSVTGFANTSDTTLVFKGNGMYRLNTISASTDPQNIFNIGAVSQEAITDCQGVVYFFSGQDIRRTTGGFPEQISRLGVQDFIDAIPQSSWSSVAAGTDGMSVYFSIGDVTLNTKQNEQTTYNRVVLKFSPRDQSWSIHSYAHLYKFYTLYTNSNDGEKMYGAEDEGNVQTINKGLSDATRPIYYEIVTQDIDYGTKSHTKTISDKLVVFSRYAEGSGIQLKTDEGNYQDVNIQIKTPVAVGKDIYARGHSFNLRWFGSTTGQSPIFDGFEIPIANDEGITE